MKISPAIVLFFLSPAVAELLSGSAPPAEFFNPLGFILLASLYGSGALLAREMKIKWKKSYVTIFLLGAAYGIIEEGLMVKSFFDPTWMDLGILGVYGRWQGINWVWAEWLTIYHSIISIAIPIALVELAYPNQSNSRWISDKKIVSLAALLMGVTAFGYLFLTNFYPTLFQYLLFVGIVGFLIILALKIPTNLGKGNLQILSPTKLFLFGFLAMFTLFLFFGAGPHIVNEPLILLISGLGLVYLFFLFLKRFDWNNETLYEKFSLIVGPLCFLIILTPFQELDKSRVDNTHGMLLVGIIALVMLLLFRKNLKQIKTSKEI